MLPQREFMKLTFNQYEDEAYAMAIYPDQGRNITYPVLGLAGETGEVADKVKKCLRDHGGHFNEQRMQDLIKEMGDVLWYLVALSREIGISLESVAQQNLEKLRDRKTRGRLQGEGDER